MASTCSSCGRDIAVAARCPHCNADQGQWADELGRIDRAIAEMKIREAAIAKEQNDIAAKLQAAQFRRDMLAHASQERLKQTSKPRLLRRVPGLRPPTADPGAQPRIPRQFPFPRRGVRFHRPGGIPFPRGVGEPSRRRKQPQPHPEASSREVQNVLLGLGALLLAVAAVVFAAVALRTLDDFSRLAILLAATALMLVAPPPVARRGLTSTAETIAALGLALVPLDGYALWTVDQVRAQGPPGPVFAGLVFVVTAAVATGYAAAARLRAPRYAAVVAVQPVLPLLAYDLTNSAVGWALVLSAVAAVDLFLGCHLLRAALPWRLDRVTDPRPGSIPPGTDTAEPPPGVAEPRRTRTDRPETAEEEPDAPLIVEPDRIEPGATAAGSTQSAGSTPDAADPADWLRHLVFVLHALAVVAALGYAVVAMLNVDTVPSAVRAGAVLLLAALIGLGGAMVVRRPPLPSLAAGVLTLAVIGAAGRVASVALPGRALLLIAVVIVVAGLGVRAVPAAVRRGPQVASAVALLVIGIAVAGAALRAAIAPVRAAVPIWDADLATYPATLAAAVGPAAWQLAATAFLLTIAAMLAVPHEVRREFAVTAAALTALAVPASFGLTWALAPWPAVLTAVGIGAAGLTARTERAARAHVIAAAVVGFAGAGAAMARPALTGAVLLALAVGGVLIVLAAAVRPHDDGPAADTVAAWASGAAAFALPGAVAAFTASTVPIHPATPAALQAATRSVLAASFLAACTTLGYAAVRQVSQRQISLPLTIGTSLGALGVGTAAFGPGATIADAWVGTLLIIAAVLLFFAPSIDAGRRPDRLLDGCDYAAAAAAAAAVGTLARLAAMLAPGIELAVSAGLVLLVAIGVRAMPPDWRRGPIVGVATSGGVLALIAGGAALKNGVLVLAAPDRLWHTDLAAWPDGTLGNAWQVPLALVLLAVAAAVVLPRPWAYDVAGVCAGLATIGAPVALGLPWWSPVVVGGAVAAGYGIAAVVAADPRAGLARAAVAAGIALHAVGVGLARPWTTAAALGIVAFVSGVVAVLARLFAALPVGRTVPDASPDRPTGIDPVPPHLAQIGGAATCTAVLALPGAVATLAVALNRPVEVAFTGALAASSLGLAAVAVARTHAPHFLPYATVGIAGGATITAVAALPTDLPVGVYAAAAVLLGVLAELLRVITPPPGATAPVRRWSVAAATAVPLSPKPGARGRWSVNPATGAMLAAALPAALAVSALAPVLVAALAGPPQTLRHVWQGPPAALTTPPADAVNATDVLAALLLTIAAALAATGFNNRRPAHAVPVVLPGVAITLLIAPISLGVRWPASTLAALAVFTISMLGLALTPPPPDGQRARPVRAARVTVFAIGLAAGGAGLTGSLAAPRLTLVTLAGAAGVGAVAALAGRSQMARVLGWLFGAVMAEAFVLTAGLHAGIAPQRSALGVLAVGAILLLAATTLPRLRRPESLREATTVEWTGHASALVALALAYDSPRYLAALFAAWGAVLGAAAARPGRAGTQWRILFWAATGCEIVAWWLLMATAHVGVPEAYTLPFAALALLVGLMELRRRPELNSWAAYGPALVAALLPTLVIVLTVNTSTVRQVLLLLGAVATLIFGSMRRQQAPVVTGAVVTAIAALHALAAYGPWLVLIPVGVVLLALGASNERRRRTQERLRALRDMR